MNNKESLNENEIIDEHSSSINQPKLAPQQNKGSQSLQNEGSPFAPKYIKNTNPQKNLINKNDVNRLQQALNKKNQPLNNQNNPTENEQKEEGKQQEQPKKEGIVKQGAKEAVTKAGGTAITAATAGAIPKPIADILASKLSGPALKMIKYSLIMFLIPILLLIIVIIPVLIAGTSSKGSSSSSSNNDDSQISSGGNCSYKLSDKTISGDIKVQLLQCGDGERGKPIPGEELVDFEKYILGVVYAEIGGGSGAGAKAQAIAARSYALTRRIPGAGEKGPQKQKDGTWILPLRNCTETQVYCDPDKGCTQKNGKTMYSGKISGRKQYKGPMSANDKTRTAIAETAGQVAVKANGEVQLTDFDQNEQDLFTSYSKQGLDAFEILKKIYDGKTTCYFSKSWQHKRYKVSSVVSNCTDSATNGSSGDFTNWKQCDSKWGSNLLGKSKTTTICKAGCAATSVAIQIAKSGVQTTFSNLNPGTFVKEYNKVGGFENDLIVWSNVNKIAPTFKFISKSQISGSKADKAKKLAEYLNKGEYVIIGVYKSKTTSTVGHWVALDKVKGSTVYINDPGQTTSEYKLFDLYPYTVSRKITVVRYKKS